MTGLKITNLEAAMLLLIAAMIEFVSAFGLYLALGHGPKAAPQLAATAVSRPVATEPDLTRPRPRGENTAPERARIESRQAATRKSPTIEGRANETAPVAMPPRAQAAPLDLIVRYSVARLEVAPGVRVPLAKVYRDYQAWCDAGGEKPVSRQLFDEVMGQVANHVDTLEVAREGRRKVLANVDFARAAEPA